MINLVNKIKINEQVFNLNNGINFEKLFNCSLLKSSNLEIV